MTRQSRAVGLSLDGIAGWPPTPIRVLALDLAWPSSSSTGPGRVPARGLAFDLVNWSAWPRRTGIASPYFTMQESQLYATKKSSDTDRPLSSLLFPFLLPLRFRRDDLGYDDPLPGKPQHGLEVEQPRHCLRPLLRPQALRHAFRGVASRGCSGILKLYPLSPSPYCSE